MENASENPSGKSSKSVTKAATDNPGMSSIETAVENVPVTRVRKPFIEVEENGRKRLLDAGLSCSGLPLHRADSDQEHHERP